MSDQAIIFIIGMVSALTLIALCTLFYGNFIKKKHEIKYSELYKVHWDLINILQQKGLITIVNQGEFLNDKNVRH